jgi:hypothetical protein
MCGIGGGFDLTFFGRKFDFAWELLDSVPDRFVVVVGTCEFALGRGTGDFGLGLARARAK